MDYYTTLHINERFALTRVHLSSTLSFETLKSEDIKALDELISIPYARLVLPLSGKLYPYPKQLYWFDKQVENIEPKCEWDMMLKEVYSHCPETSSTESCIIMILSLFPLETLPMERISDVPGKVASSLLFTNERINIWEGLIQVNEVQNVHEHLYPYLFINRVEAKTLGLTDQFEPVEENIFPKEHWRYVDVYALSGRRIHSAKNIHDQVLEEYLIEFKD